ncbi:MAG: shikimate dehydrogenase, partial [Planctomycetes bacterium]|nr:shikimate dehydrogenase [Planctomycetota bacterium]
LNCVYLPMRVPRDSLKETIESFRWLDVRGYSVTIPHKETILDIAEETSELVQRIGAANTLYFDRNGTMHAANTDYDAALEAILQGIEAPEPNLPPRVAGMSVLILGAGGVARAIALGLMTAGATVTITNRNPNRAVELAESLGCKHVKWENRAAETAEILVNCTPLGMHPHSIDETPFPVNWFRDGMLVFDTVYNPENTLLLKDARQHQCRTVSGLEMFVRQAARQFEYFTGEAAPLETMRTALRRGISPVKQ